MSKAFLIDTTLCTACRGCQVACKQWHDLPAESTTNQGSYQNPQDLSFDTYKLVRMTETVIDGKLNWLFFPDQCRHCIEAPCLETAGEPSAIYQDPATGAIIYTANTRYLDAEEIIASCPYNIPRKAEDGTLAKCDMCNDRVHNGLLPACVKTCPTGTMNFGNREEMLELARQRLEVVKRSKPKAQLLDAPFINVIYLVAEAPGLYNENAVAGHAPAFMTRHVALRRLFGPFGQAASRLA
jgi:formate dehydrogenase iron-sulfur subunit